MATENSRGVSSLLKRAVSKILFGERADSTLFPPNPELREAETLLTESGSVVFSGGINLGSYPHLSSCCHVTHLELDVDSTVQYSTVQYSTVQYSTL